MWSISRLFAAFLLFSTVSHAELLSDPPYTEPGILSSIGFISVLLSTATVPVAADIQHEGQFTLPDGTKLGSLLYIDSSKGPRPLIIADFGLMSPHDSSLAGDVIEKLVVPGLLNANFLVLDDITSADFYVNNGTLSLGGYDAGRVLNELADFLKNENSIPFTSLHLMGESLGGLAVLEALVEDQSLGTKHFSSAITFSGVTDEARDTEMVLSHFGHDLRGIDGPSLSMEGSLFLDASAEEFEHTVSSDSNLPAPTLDTAGDFFYDQFASRLASLNGVSGWNSAVSRASVEDYVTTSSARLSLLSQTSAPVIAVHAADDPVVPYSEFQSFAQAQASNPSVLTLGTDDGSHCGFLGVYGAQWVADLINRALTLTATSNTK